jgi:hypothetical protein
MAHIVLGKVVESDDGKAALAQGDNHLKDDLDNFESQFGEGNGELSRP